MIDIREGGGGGAYQISVGTQGIKHSRLYTEPWPVGQPVKHVIRNLHPYEQNERSQKY